MAWCRQATSHYLSQCWPISMSPYGVTRQQWINVITKGSPQFELNRNETVCYSSKYSWKNIINSIKILSATGNEHPMFQHNLTNRHRFPWKKCFVNDKNNTYCGDHFQWYPVNNADTVNWVLRNRLQWNLYQNKKKISNKIMHCRVLPAICLIFRPCVYVVRMYLTIYFIAYKLKDYIENSGSIEVDCSCYFVEKNRENVQVITSKQWLIRCFIWWH